MTGVIGTEDLRCPSAKHYPRTWNVLGETLEPLLETLFSDVETPKLYEAVEAVERVVDALEASLVDVQRMQVRVSEAEAELYETSLKLEASRMVKPATVAEATRFRWHFLLDEMPLFLVPVVRLQDAKSQAVEFLELWNEEHPKSNARSVVSDYGEQPEGVIVHDFVFGGEDGLDV